MNRPVPPHPATRVALIAHGSRDQKWRGRFEKLVERVEASLGAGRVALCYMEIARPTLEDVALEAERDGVERLRVLPLFMAGGGHVDRDIPAQAREVGERHPRLAVEVLPAIGEHAAVVEAMREVIRETATGLPPGE